MLTVAGEDAVEGKPFCRYRLAQLLGRGGMGEMWRAHDTETDRIVAIKVLRAHLSEDEEIQRRFRRKAHAAARLNTPHVIPIHWVRGPDIATVRRYRDARSKYKCGD